ncbi:AT-hook motif nuclear-localized protein 3 [Linum perenne]
MSKKMEAPQGIVSSGVTVAAPESFKLAPGAEYPNPDPAPAPAPAPNSIQFGIQPAGNGGTDGKKKRGRPRKYRPDGSLSPMPISASIPLTGGEFSAAAAPPPPSWKRGRGKGNSDSVKKHQRIDYHSPGEGVGYAFGANFMPHILSVNAGEDVSMKIMSFSSQSDRAICILSANGPISNVTLRQPTSSGGTLTYEGRFEILTLSGSYLLTETRGTKSRTGGMSISLSGPDGRVLGGGLAGLLIAAGPVQVVLASFIPGNQRTEPPPPPPPQMATTPARVTVLTAEELKAAYAAAKPAIPPPEPFHRENNNHHLPSFNHVHMFMNPSSENKSGSIDDEDEVSRGGHEQSTSPCEVSC